VALSRRDFLKAGLIGGAAAALPIAEWARVGAGGSSGGFVPSPKAAKFVRELAPINWATPTGMAPWEGDGDLVPHYDIFQRKAQLEILPGLRTEVFTYNGIVPGPAFKLRKDERVAVTQHNLLSERIGDATWATSTHLHGSRVKALYDGHPVFNRCFPQQSFHHFYPNHQEAITMWYHDHNFGDTGEHVWRGMAAFFLVIDEHEQELRDQHALPHDDFDIPLCIMDKAFNADGSIRYPRTTNDDPVRQGAFGDVILINGQPFPKITVEPRKYRFRLLNGSNARFYNLRLSTGDPFSVVQTDGGLIPRRADTEELFIAQAERYSIVIDFAKHAGQRVILQNTIDPDPFGDPVPQGFVNELMAFDVMKPKSARPDCVVPDVLNEWAPWYENVVVDGEHRSFNFGRRNGMWVINGQPYAEDRFDAEPRVNTTEVWDIVNDSGAWLHPVHIHLVEFRMLERNGRPIKNFEQGPKDVIALGPNESVRVAINFDGDEQWFSDRDVREGFNALVYPMHCHNLEHEDHDMMTQFRIRPH